MKKFLSLVLCVLLICTVFSACTNSSPAPESGSPGDTNSAESFTPVSSPEGSSSEGNSVQNDPAKDGSARPLRLFVDQWAGYLGMVSYKTEEEVVEEFLERVKQQGGPTDIEVEIMPSRTEDRQTELNRIRVEMMAGAGPDVFISTSLRLYSNWNPQYQALFQFPEQAMRRGMFLKLDEYIENAQFMEWDKLNPVVMSAGATENGQYLLPLEYSFPLTYFLADDADPYPATTTWAEVAAGNDPALNTSMEARYNPDGYPYFYGTEFLSLTWKDLVDPDSETLLISEEDLLQRAKEALALEENNTTELPHFREPMNRYLFDPTAWNMGGNSDFIEQMYQGITYTDDLTMIPLYCDEGGAVVPVRAYAGINAATERPEDAFFLLDVLLSEDCQGKSMLFEGWGETPVCDENAGVMMAPIREAYLEARSQIVSARIVSPLDAAIAHAMAEYQELLDSGEATE